MLTAFVFVLGAVNFALHRWVIESGHPLVRELVRRIGDRAGYAVEFLVLVAALAFAQRGSPAAALIYAAYTASNGLAAFLLLGRRP